MIFQKPLLIFFLNFWNPNFNSMSSLRIFPLFLIFYLFFFFNSCMIPVFIGAFLGLFFVKSSWYKYSVFWFNYKYSPVIFFLLLGGLRHRSGVVWGGGILISLLWIQNPLIDGSFFKYLEIMSKCILQGENPC